MRLSRVYIDQPLQPGASIELPPDKAHYLAQVLRLKNGQSVILFNGHDSFDYRARIRREGKSSLHVDILDSGERHNDSNLDITLIQAIGKSEAIDFCIQKATELGVSAIYLFNAERTQFPVKRDKQARKLGHWAGIMQSACEQCGRNSLVDIQFSPSLEARLGDLSAANRLLLDFNAAPLADFKRADSNESFQLLVGPEGGLSDKERQLAAEAGFNGYTIGPRVLRMETATIAATTLIQHRFGDM